MGYWLALPMVLVLYEKCHRIADRALTVQATLGVMDDVVKVVCFEPFGKKWSVTPGQYILLLMPSVSKLQWHPFTVSACGDGYVEIHIKCKGRWSERLRQLAHEKALQRVYLSGPFGAPAQRHSEYQQVIMFGCGIGITPLSAILRSMTGSAAEQPQIPYALPDGTWSHHQLLQPGRASINDSGPDDSASEISECGMHRRSDSLPSLQTQNEQTQQSLLRHSRSSSVQSADSNSSISTATSKIRKIDFHLIVREERNLAAFTRLISATETGQEHGLPDHVEMHLSTHFTGLKGNPRQFVPDAAQLEGVPCIGPGALHRHISHGRPDMETLLRKHFLELVACKADQVDVAVFVSPIAMLPV